MIPLFLLCLPTDFNLSENNKKTIQFIEDITLNFGDVQKKVHEEILSQCLLEYLQRHALKVWPIPSNPVHFKPDTTVSPMVVTPQSRALSHLFLDKVCSPHLNN